jgi:hypothetical protein
MDFGMCTPVNAPPASGRIYEAKGFGAAGRQDWIGFIACVAMPRRSISLLVDLATLCSKANNPNLTLTPSPNPGNLANLT